MAGMSSTSWGRFRYGPGPVGLSATNQRRFRRSNIFYLPSEPCWRYSWQVQEVPSMLSNFGSGTKIESIEGTSLTWPWIPPARFWGQIKILLRRKRRLVCGWQTHRSLGRKRNRPQDVEDIPASSPAYKQSMSMSMIHTWSGVCRLYAWLHGMLCLRPTVVYGTGYYYSPWYGTVLLSASGDLWFQYALQSVDGMEYGIPFQCRLLFYHGYGYGGYGGYWDHPCTAALLSSISWWHVWRTRPTYINNILISTLIIQTTSTTPQWCHDQRYQSRDRQTAATRHPHNLPRANRPSTKPSTGQEPFGQPRPSTQPSTGDKASVQPRPSTKQADAPTRQTPIQSPAQNNVYADKNGNVYQRNDNGSWNQRSNNQWQSAQQPSSMNSAYQSRDEVHRPAEVISRWTMG